ncbi:MAG: chromate reductase [Paraglaciecola sp.]|jgi:chromate reductase
MITIICGTNRPNSETAKFSKKYFDLLKAKGTDVKLLELEKIPHDWFFAEMYDSKKQAESIAKVQEEYFFSADKLLFVSPEYNGSFPGVLKLFLDAISIREYPRNFKNKKAALSGIASGRAGNLRGIDHLTGVLHHVGTTVMPQNLPISSIGGLKNEDGEINEATEKLMGAFLDTFLAF